MSPGIPGRVDCHDRASPAGNATRPPAPGRLLRSGQGTQTLTANPGKRASGQPGGQRDGPRSTLHHALGEREERLRQLVAGYSIDPEIINEEALDTIKKVTTEIYRILTLDAKDPNGVLAGMPAVWADLDKFYRNISIAAMSFRPMLKRLRDLDRQPNPPAAELGEAAIRVAERAENWLIRITEFQENLSAFHKGLSEGKSA